MFIGLPKEIKPDEYRVAATPAAVGEYVVGAAPRVVAAE